MPNRNSSQGLDIAILTVTIICVVIAVVDVNIFALGGWLVVGILTAGNIVTTRKAQNTKGSDA